MKTIKTFFLLLFIGMGTVLFAQDELRVPGMETTDKITAQFQFGKKHILTATRSGKEIKEVLEGINPDHVKTIEIEKKDGKSKITLELKRKRKTRLFVQNKLNPKG